MRRSGALAQEQEEPWTDTVKEFFEWFARKVRREQAGITNSYLFEIKEVGTWLVSVDDGKVTVDEGEAEADVRIGMSEETSASSSPASRTRCEAS